VILGVSPDSPAKHRKFKAKFELPFTLIADTEHKVSEAYGVWVEKNMMGKKYMGVARTTFIIDRDGRIAKVFEKVNALGHANEVAEIIDEMRAPA
jgi:peroxiredoxin Q/BCP